MDSPTSCPSESALRDLVSGKLTDPKSQSVHDHLARCGPCRTRVDNLETEIIPDHADPTVCPSNLLPRTTPDEDDWIGDGDPEDRRSRTGEETIDLGFLEPSKSPRSIGRLGDNEILNILGEGGMGIVFKAFDESLHRVVAIKVLGPGLAASLKARRRFIREARAAAAINHPNIVTIHAVNIEQEMPYLVMEYISGVSLRQRIRKGPPLGTAEILRIGAQIATGLAAAHEQGVIHRDIKPANIMLEDGVERVKITDFGLALAGMDRSGITSMGQIVGTPAYMSPEQIGGTPLDARSDLFGLGCVLYAMATGHSPFQGMHTLDVIRKVCDDRPRPLYEVKPGVPRDLSQLVERLLEKDPKNRPQSAKEVSTLLLEQLVRANQAGNETGTSVAGDLAATVPAKRRRWPWVLAVPGAALLLLVLALVLIFRDGIAGALDLGAHATGPKGREATHPIRRPATPASPRIVKVAQDGKGEVTSIGAALERAGPGDTIRILDGATYRESIRIADRTRWSGLTLEAPGGAHLVPVERTIALTVRDVADVKIRGLRIENSVGRHGVLVEGATTGLIIEDVHAVQSSDIRDQRALVRIAVDHPGVPGATVLFRHCRLENQGLGIAILDPKNGNRPLGGVRLEDNVFTGTGVHVLIQGKVSDVVLSGNRFLGGLNGVNLNFPEPAQAGRIVVVNNTFFQTAYWLGLVYSVAEQQGITLCNNLVLSSKGVQWAIPGQLDDVARSWDFHNNWWEPGEQDEAEPPTDPPTATLQTSIEVLSRDPDAADFLRPGPASALVRAGAGGPFPSYIGALPPREAPPR